MGKTSIGSRSRAPQTASRANVPRGVRDEAEIVDTAAYIGSWASPQNDQGRGENPLSAHEANDKRAWTSVATVIAISKCSTPSRTAPRRPIRGSRVRPSEGCSSATSNTLKSRRRCRPMEVIRLSGYTGPKGQLRQGYCCQEMKNNGVTKRSCRSPRWHPRHSRINAEDGVRAGAEHKRSAARK